MTTTVLAYIPSPPQGVWYLFGVVPLRAYALCIIVGIIAALVIGDRRWVARGGERGVIYDVALWAVPFGLIGGRLYHVMTDWTKYFGADGAGFAAALRIWDGGLGIWGAVALGGVGAWIACRRRGIPLPAFGDAIAPGIILAQAIGRLGNYFNQELYGRDTDLPWGLTIYERLDPSGVVSPYSLDGVSTGQVYAVVHPTFLYELLWNLLIFALLLWVDRRFKIGHGRLFALYVAGYCVGRFWVELMRSDAATLIAGIRINTFTSMFVFIAAVIYIMVAPKGREDPLTLKRGDLGDDRRSPLDELGEELTAVAATSGVVAAAKVAGDDERSAESEPGSEAAVEAEDLVEQVESAPSEDIAEAEAFAEAGAEADADREAGFGSVEGDEGVEAEDGAVEVHEAAVEAAEPEFDEPVAAPEVIAVALDGTEVAEALDAEPEPEELAAEVVEAAAEGADEAEALVEDVAAETQATEGLGSVDGDEAEALVEDVAAEDSALEAPAETEPTDGRGSVEGDEAVAAEESAAEVHEAAVEGTDEAEALAEDVAAEAEATEGMGSVDGDEAAAAEESATEVHEAAAEGAAEAEASAEEIAQPDQIAETSDERPRRRWWRRG